MIVVLIFLGILVIMGPAALLAYILSIPANITWRDEGFQKWAFGHLVEENASMYDLVCLWNRRNPEHRTNCGENPQESVKKMVQRYIKEKHSNE